jgi:hypothetical protein
MSEETNTMIRRPFLSSAATPRGFIGLMTGLAAGAALSFAAPIAVSAQDNPPADSAEEGADPMTKGEKRLARMLEGRVAGKPVDCIRVAPSQPMTTIDKTAYVYGRGKTIYVQRTANPENIDDNDVLVSRRFRASELCRQDVMTTIDPILGFFTGTVFFEEFVPFTRIDDEGEGEA